jgi:hypothetical protein
LQGCQAVHPGIQPGCDKRNLSNSRAEYNAGLAAARIHVIDIPNMAEHGRIALQHRGGNYLNQRIEELVGLCDLLTSFKI